MNSVFSIDIQLRRKDFELNIQAEIPNGITGIYGPSGHGKTTLLHLLTGLTRPESGLIIMEGTTLFDSKKGINIPVKDRKIGYVFQDIRLFPHLTVEQNLKYGAKRNKRADVGFQELIEVLQISSILKKHPAECSGGEQQRISIGRAILSGAHVLLMDEPFSAVDVQLRNTILPFLNEINCRFHIPMLIVSHDLPDLLSLSDHLLLLKNGSVKGMGRFRDLIQEEANCEMMKEAGLYNVFDLVIEERTISSEMILLRNQSSDFEVQVMKSLFHKEIELGKTIKVLIRPEDISIALHKIEHISLRNQILGTITKIFSRNGLSFCIVDAGEKVLVEITEASLKNMNLVPGTQVYCLFKSAALKIFE